VERRRRKLHNEELHNLCPSPEFIRMLKIIDEMDRACSMHGRDRECMVGKPGERYLEDPCVNARTILKYLKGIEWEGVD
jgi:hypothetical protein